MSMGAEKQTDLEKRLARFIAERLAIDAPDEPPLLRLLAAYRAAEEILTRAKWGGTPLAELAAKLDQFTATDYEI